MLLMQPLNSFPVMLTTSIAHESLEPTPLPIKTHTTHQSG